MFLGYLIHDHRSIERDHEGPLGAFCEKGDVGCEYSILQGARPLLVNDVHPIRIAIKRDPGIKVSLVSSSRASPSLLNTLNPLYSGGLWLAVIITPADLPKDFVW